MSEKRKPLSEDALAGDIHDKGSEVLGLTSRIERYSNAKGRQLEIVKHLRGLANGKIQESKTYTKIDYNKLSSKLGCCGNYLVFHQYYTIDKVRLAKASTCKDHLVCNLCAIRRGAKQVQAYLGRFTEIMANNPHLVPYFVTLTVKNGHDFSERFNHLQSSVKSLLKSRRNFKSRGTGFNEFCKLEGAVYSYELTHSKKHGWHPHLHMVVLVNKNDLVDFDPKRPKQSKLSKDWLSITGDSFIVDSRPILGDPAEGFCEVFKYALKYSSMSIDNNLTAYSYLKGKRLQGSFGEFRGVKVPNDSTDDLLSNLPYIELFYKYTKAGYSLKTTKMFEVERDPKIDASYTPDISSDLAKPSISGGSRISDYGRNKRKQLLTNLRIDYILADVIDNGFTDTNSDYLNRIYENEDLRRRGLPMRPMIDLGLYRKIKSKE